MIHQSVLKNEVLQALNPRPGEFMIDGTLGGGGHARLLHDAVGEQGRLLVIDEDRTAIENFITYTSCRMPHITTVQENFAHLVTLLAREGLGKADGLLLDLGLSSDQLSLSGRGFTFQKNEPLLMTLSDRRSALRDRLKHIDVMELEQIIHQYSGERFAHRIAKEIMRAVGQMKMETTFDLRNAIVRAVPRNYEAGRIDPATRTFLALRMYANSELENLHYVLDNLAQIIKLGGRIAIITFHSVEDRLVKQELKVLAKKGTIALLNKKVIKPSREEIALNPRARSAKLRAAIVASPIQSNESHSAIFCTAKLNIPNTIH